MNHEQLRNVLTDYQEEQVLENLIRSKNHYPIIHFDIGTVTATISSEVSGTLNGGQSLENSGILSKVTRPFTFSVSPTAKDKLDVKVNPQTGINKIYRCYHAARDFLMCESEDAPPPPRGQEHVGKRWKKDGVYYWIPKDRAKEFYALAMVVSVLREPGSKTSGGQESKETTNGKKVTEPAKVAQNKSPNDPYLNWLTKEIDERINFSKGEGDKDYAAILENFKNAVTEEIPAEAIATQGQGAIESVTNELRLQRLQ